MKNTSISTYSETFVVKTYDIDIHNRLTPSALMGYMQEVATKHAERLQLGYRPSYDAGYIWVLRSAKFELDRLPILGEQLEVETWPAGIEGLKAKRRFTFRSGGEIIGQGYNDWLMLDLKRNRPIVSDYFLEKVKDLPVSKSDPFKLKRISIPESLKVVHLRPVYNTDLDQNLHVNNVRYVDMAYDALSPEWLKQSFIVGLQIEYLREAKLEDTLEIRLGQSSSDIYVDGLSREQPVFRCLMKCTKSPV